MKSEFKNGLQSASRDFWVLKLPFNAAVHMVPIIATLVEIKKNFRNNFLIVSNILIFLR